MAGQGLNQPNDVARQTYEYLILFLKKILSPPEVASSTQNVVKRKKKNKVLKIFCCT